MLKQRSVQLPAEQKLAGAGCLEITAVAIAEPSSLQTHRLRNAAMATGNWYTACTFYP